VYKQGGLNKYYQSKWSLLLRSQSGRKIAKKTAVRIGATMLQSIPEDGVSGVGGGVVDSVEPASLTVNEPGSPLTSTE